LPSVLAGTTSKNLRALPPPYARVQDPTGLARALVAVNHVDDTGRLQSVARQNPLYYDLMGRAQNWTAGCAEHGFNENGQSSVHPRSDRLLFALKMDVLVIGPFVCKKEPTWD
jgi:predicted NodU family carbamoyl transferase